MPLGLSGDLGLFGTCWGSVYKYPEVLAEVSLLPMTGQAGPGELAELCIALLYPFLFFVLKAIDPSGANCWWKKDFLQTEHVVVSALHCCRCPVYYKEWALPFILAGPQLILQMTGISNLLSITCVWKLADWWWKFPCYKLTCLYCAKPGELAPWVPHHCQSVP